MLQKTLTKIYSDLSKEALYLQKGELQKSLTLTETNGQRFNFEPLVWMTAALAINEFIKGVFSGFGKKLSDLITEKISTKTAQKPTEVSEIVLLLKADLDKLQAIIHEQDTTKKHLDDGLELMKAHLIRSGIPSYKASVLIARWRCDLAGMIHGKHLENTPETTTS